MIRPATSADQGAVGALFGEFLAALGYAPDPELDKDMADFPRAYSGPGNTFVVATTVEGKIVAMGGLMDREIRRLFVHPSHRGKGIARGILNWLIQFHRNHGNCILRAIVSRTNLAANRLFFNSGFRPTGRTPPHPKMKHCQILTL